MSATWRATVLAVGLAGCNGGSDLSVWSEPLVATSDGGALILTHITAFNGDVGDERCDATRITHVSVALATRQVASGTSALCDAARLGSVHVGLNERGRMLFADVSDRWRLKTADPTEDRTTVLADGCMESEPVLAADGRSNRVAIHAHGCGQSKGYWIRILRLDPGVDTILGVDSLEVRFQPRGVALGPGLSRLLMQVNDTTGERIILVDLETGGVREMSRGKLPGSQSTGTGFAFIRDDRDASGAWALMYADSVAASPRELLTLTQARALIGDPSAIHVSAPVVSLDNQHVWIGVGGQVLRVHVTSRTVELVAP